MGLIELEPGYIVDEDTGEIQEYPEGADPFAMAAHRFREAKEQAKEWGAIAGRWQSVLLRGQETRRAVYGATVITLRHDKYTAFNAEDWRALAESAEFTMTEWRQLAIAAKNFDLSLLGDDDDGDLNGFVRQFFEEKPKSPFAMVTVITKHAPPIRPYIQPETTDDE